MSGATAAIAAFACERSEPDPARADDVGRVLLDTVGCALAAAGSPIDGMLRRLADRERTSGAATVWLTGDRVAPAQAALLNATAGHALDWDDVSPEFVMHPSVVLLPALLAHAESSGASGAEVVAAHDVGAAVMRAVANALPRSIHYGRGWHTTSTVGRLAATAAAAALARLDERETRHALGIAASLAAGSLANFGTMTKPLHAGVAARDAVQAAGLAADGFTANERQLEAPGGFFALYGELDERRLEGVRDELDRWRREWPSDWALKRYPACYATHRAIDAVLELRDPRRPLPERVEVVVEPGGLRPLIPTEPTSPTEAKFSMAYAVATALVHGEARLRHFDDDAFRNGEVRDLLPRITGRESAVPPLGPASFREGYAVVTLFPGDAARVDETYGDARKPLSDADLRQKFADCCEAGGLDPVETERLELALRTLPRAERVGPISTHV